jgi:hypothetical protein
MFPEMTQGDSGQSLVNGVKKNPHWVNSNRPILIDQGGRRIPIWPISSSESVQDFYSYGTPYPASANTDDDLEISETSQIFFYVDTTNEILSLVVIHDRFVDGAGGKASFEIDGLPVNSLLAVQDDPGEDAFGTFDFSPPTATLGWNWSSCCTDGAAISVDTPFSITIVHSYPNLPFQGIDTWVARSLHPSGRMDLIELDVDKPLRLFRPGK